MKEKFGVAFVGCTHPHVFPRYDLLKQEPDIEFIGLYEPDAELAEELSKRFGIPAFATAKELLDQNSVQIVVIDGWDTANPEYAILALERNLAVLVEKPGAPNLTEMKRLTSVASKSKGIFQIGYMMRYSPAVERIKEILEAEVLGEITLARFHAASPVGCAAEVWQSVPGDLGGVVYTDGCHMVATIQQLFGRPDSVKGSLLKLPKGPQVVSNYFKKDTLSDLGEKTLMPLGGLMYEDGGVAVLDYGDKLVSFDVTGWEANPWVEAWKIEIFGTDGTLHAGLQPPWYSIFLHNPKPGWQTGISQWNGFGVEGAGNSLVVDENYKLEMMHFLSRIRMNDNHNQPWIKEAEDVVSILDALFRSHKEAPAIPLR